MPEFPVTLSIVSHRQNRLVNQLLEDVQRVCAPRVALVVTENARDAVPIGSVQGARPDELILNQVRRGFGANHNAAFRHCRTPYFCVCNPDVRLTADPFPALLAVMLLADNYRAFSYLFVALCVGVFGALSVFVEREFRTLGKTHAAARNTTTLALWSIAVTTLIMLIMMLGPHGPLTILTGV